MFAAPGQAAGDSIETSGGTCASLSLWVRNILDKDVQVANFLQVRSGVRYANYLTRRTVGAELRISFGQER
jgi:hypothetical protein